jgi:tetratricopeptide (TPR) repeat protein
MTHQSTRLAAAATILATGVLAPHHAQAFSRLKTCYLGPELTFSIDDQILNCTTLVEDRGRPTEERASNYYGRGLLYQLKGEDDRAIDDFNQAIGWQRDYRDAYEARGDAFAHAGQIDKAAADYAQSAALGDDQPWNLAERCWVRAIRGYPLDRAVADCNAALKELPDQWQILYSRSFAYLRMANYPAAIADCEAANKQRERLDGALYVCGLAKLRSGDTAGGNADLAAAKDANYRVADIFALYGVKP